VTVVLNNAFIPPIVQLLPIPSTGRFDSNLDTASCFMLLPLCFNIPWLLNLRTYLPMKIDLHGEQHSRTCMHSCICYPTATEACTRTRAYMSVVNFCSFNICHLSFSLINYCWSTMHLCD